MEFVHLLGGVVQGRAFQVLGCCKSCNLCSLLTRAFRRECGCAYILGRFNLTCYRWSLVSSAVVLGFLVVGCGSSGTNFDSAKVSQIKKGETREAQLIQWFHDPEQRTIDSDGNTHLIWRYSEAEANASNFIPIYGAFAHGSHGGNKMLRLTLKNGIVTNYEATEGTSGARTGTQSPQ